MSELKYPKAVYRDQDSGKLITIRADELANAAILERARLEELFDETEQTHLTPRAGDIKVPHFAGRPSGGRRLFQGERDEEHDERVTRLVNALSSQESWALGMLGAKKSNNEPPDFYQDTILSDYRWGSETNRIMDEQTIVRHDIFGASSTLSMSVRQPSIAIEVVKTHYPEEAAFTAFIEKSKREPFIVFFDVIKCKEQNYTNTFVKVDAELRRISYRPYTFLVREGKVYKGNRPTEIETSARLRIEVEEMIAAWQRYRAGKA
ncbi:hypothetical protein P3T43_005377 [Paraburkholderia sp. GAS41]|uniref:hypothetical protein n=1 Tax=Paraburkholderia sp. GAS41 TaxID=3035134 RepID=UPI003D209201